MAHFFINCGIYIGFCAGAMVLLRPLLCRVFTAQQRVFLWWFCVGLLYFFNSFELAGQAHFFLPKLSLPVHLYDLITNQTWKDVMAHSGRKPYYVDLSGQTYLDAIYLLSVSLILIWVIYRSIRAGGVKKLGIPLSKDELRLKNIDMERVEHVYVVEGLPTSYVDGSYNIFLQKTYSPEQMRYVLLHETEHIHLYHMNIKAVFSFLLFVYWWNPLIWLGFRYMVRDMELACDSAVLSKLTPEERVEYAKTLVELGSGRQLWTRPTCFGECDAEIRVREALKWKPQSKKQQLARFALMAVVIWFFRG